jgi:hypothetical protein
VCVCARRQASCHLPVLLGSLTTEFRGGRYIDGGLGSVVPSVQDSLMVLAFPPSFMGPLLPGTVCPKALLCMCVCVCRCVCPQPAPQRLTHAPLPPFLAHVKANTHNVISVPPTAIAGGVPGLLRMAMFPRYHLSAPPPPAMYLCIYVGMDVCMYVFYVCMYVCRYVCMWWCARAASNGHVPTVSSFCSSSSSYVSMYLCRDGCMYVCILCMYVCM